KYLSDARTILADVMPRLPASPEREKVAQGVMRLAALDVKRRVPKLDAKTDWAKLLDECKNAEPTGWVLACKAECLLEKSGSKIGAADLKQAVTDANDKRVAETGVYGQYVRALALYRDGKPDAAGDALLEALPAEPPGFLLGHRRQRAIEVLRAAIHRQ